MYVCTMQCNARRLKWGKEGSDAGRENDVVRVKSWFYKEERQWEWEAKMFVRGEGRKVVW